MLNNIRNFSKTIFAKILLVIIIIPFVFWGMGGIFSSGNTNSLAKINKKNISTQDFIEYLNKSNFDENLIRDNIDKNVLEDLLGKLISDELLNLEIEDLNLIISEKVLADRIKKNNNFIDENSDDFEFNQDINFDDPPTRSPGWIRYQKKLNDK